MSAASASSGSAIPPDARINLLEARAQLRDDRESRDVRAVAQRSESLHVLEEIAVDPGPAGRIVRLVQDQSRTALETLRDDLAAGRRT